MSVLQDLAHFVANLTYDQLSSSSIEKAKNCFFDTYGVIIMGSSDPTSINLQNLFHETRANQNGATVIGTDKIVDMAGAAFLNAYASHVDDYDDSCYAGMTHPSAVIVPCLCALSNYAKASGKDMITAFMAGWEVAGRIGLSLPKLLVDGWQCASLFGSIGAVAAAANLLKLNAEQSMHAISLLLCQVGGIRQSNGTKGKPFTLGKASENAVTAALCAKSGHQGSLEMLEGKQGFFSVFCKNTQDMSVFNSIGKPLVMDSHGVCVKKHPFCSSAHAPVEAANVLMKNHNIDYNKIKSIHCNTTNIVLQYLIYHNPKDVVEAQFSLPYLIASTIFHGEFIFSRDLSLENLNNETICKIMKKITWQGDETLGPDKRSETDFPEGAMLTITLENGETLSHCVYDPEGFPTSPMTKNALIEKFTTCVGKYLSNNLSEQKIEKFADMTFNLEKLDNMNEWKLV